MLEPNQSLKFNGSPVYSDWGWNDVDNLIIESTTFSTWDRVRRSIRVPIEDVTLFQLQLPTMRLIYGDLENVRT